MTVKLLYISYCPDTERSSGSFRTMYVGHCAGKKIRGQIHILMLTYVWMSCKERNSGCLWRGKLEAWK